MDIMLTVVQEVRVKGFAYSRIMAVQEFETNTLLDTSK